MTAALLAFAWAALVVAALFRIRPAPRRVRTIIGAGTRRSFLNGSDGERPVGCSSRRDQRPLTERLGQLIVSKTKWSSSQRVDALTARRVGAAALGALATLPVFPPAAIAGAVLGWAIPSVRAARVEKRRLAALAADLPDVVDLLVLAVGAGLTVHLALEAVGRRATGPMAAELRKVTDEVAVGARLADALDEVPKRAGEAVRPLVSALAAAERYGAPLVASLERLAAEVRQDRRRRAEEVARRVPVKLIFPLVTCTLPAFALLTVAPLIASALRSLHI